jgi:hypothetical protein
LTAQMVILGIAAISAIGITSGLAATRRVNL